VSGQPVAVVVGGRNVVSTFGSIQATSAVCAAWVVVKSEVAQSPRRKDDADVRSGGGRGCGARRRR